MISEPPSRHLTYTIAGSSEPSGHYVAENVMVDRPGDLMSRWSGSQNVPIEKHWLTLRLDSRSVVSEYGVRLSSDLNSIVDMFYVL
jgi:muskelin